MDAHTKEGASPRFEPTPARAEDADGSHGEESPRTEAPKGATENPGCNGGRGLDADISNEHDPRMQFTPPSDAWVERYVFPVLGWMLDHPGISSTFVCVVAIGVGALVVWGIGKLL